MHAVIQHLPPEILCRSDGASPQELRLDGEGAISQLESWAAGYDTAVRRGDHQTGGIQEIYNDLAEAFAITLKLGYADGIGAVGELLAQVLAMGGHKDDALTVLDHAEAAYTKLGNAQGIEGVRQLRKMIGGG